MSITNKWNGKISIVITTYDRVDLLELVLKDLSRQTANPADYEVIVIDNAGQAECRRLTQESGYKYIHEPKVGHCHARNRGLKEATFDWVLYFDDDVRLPTNIGKEFLTYLRIAGQIPGVAAFGGRFDHWYLEPPAPWLQIEQGVGKFPGKAKAGGVLPEGQYLIGCFFAVNKETTLALGGFDPEFGMKGKEIGWADETELQVRLREHNYIVYYAPELVISHLVQPWKCSFKGQLKHAYSLGKNKWVPNEENSFSLLYLAQEIIRITFVVFPVTMARWLLAHREWYWQNAALRVLPKYAFILGRTHKRKLILRD